MRSLPDLIEISLGLLRSPQDMGEISLDLLRWGNEGENSEVFAQIGPLKSQPILKPDIWLADVRCWRHIPTIDCYTSWIKWVPVGMTLGRVDSSSLGLDWIALILLHVHAWFKYKLQAMDKNAEIKKRKENSFRLKCLGPLKVQINGHFIKVLPQLSNIVIPAHSKLEAPWQSTTLSTNWNKGIDWLVHI